MSLSSYLPTPVLDYQSFELAAAAGYGFPLASIRGWVEGWPGAALTRSLRLLLELFEDSGGLGLKFS